ncbi:hypothetical protein NPS33_25055 [Pseudomonas putida]|uniref:hypothetical protein n=1 Tax=Pseudomonas putida TaxID=303 RepID=UPI0023643926|nr:hypothetical protein [Pseudomonas putida]MDD2018117.1 hypothetical protein [Pseudomonas putida]HDS1770688.1 hypothetical protein [Pseudomonas putida]
MSTENRSSNTEMVSFPRELSDDLAELIATRARVCGGGALEIWDAICDSFGKSLDGHNDVAIQALNSTIESRVELSGALDLLRRIRSARDWNGSHVGLKKEIDAALSRATQAPQPHAEPMAWMVGTAIWWTKEEAERDAAATGLPIVGLGPMTEPGEIDRLRTMFDQTDSDLRSVTAERDTLRAEADRLRQEVASIDKKLRGNVSDPDPLKPIMPGALSITTTYGLVAGIVRERDQLRKALERQPS